MSPNPARAALTLVAAVGVVGACRQRWELDQIRRGCRAPIWAATSAVPGSSHGPIATRVAAWHPQRPVTRAGQVVAATWAAPVTFAGLLVAAASGVWPRWRPDAGVLVAVGAGGLAARSGVDATALGHVIICRRDRLSPKLLVHELAHVRQAERLGPLLIPTYAWWLARHGYRDNPLECGARGATRAVLDVRTGRP